MLTVIIIVLVVLLLLGAFGVQQGTISIDRLLLVLIFLLVLYLVFGSGRLSLR